MKMKNIADFKRYLSLRLVAGSLFLTLSCTNDILNTVPQNSINELNAFSSPEKVLAQVNSLYSGLQEAGFLGGRLILFNEQRGEEFSQNSGNAAEGALIWQHNALSTDSFVSNLWSIAYRVINRANILIDRVSGSTVIPEELKKQYIAEAKFTRAVAYFHLVQVYARPFAQENGKSPGIPLRLNPETSSGNDDLAKSPVEKVYEQIIRDLDEAEADLPAGYATDALNTSRAHRATAIALKTRVQLTRGDYAAVVKEAKKLAPSAAAPFVYTEGSTTHKLEADISAVFKGSYVGNEAIFFIPFSSQSFPGAQSALAHNYLGALIISINPQGIFLNPALSSPESKDARSKLITTKNGLNVLNKFPKISTPFTDYIPVLRYAEVLLNYAEAAAELGDLAQAQALLNAVRKRSDPAFVFPAGQTATKEALIQTILTERRIEFLGEGFRTPDLQRRLQPFPAKVGGIGSVGEVRPGAENYIWPIPADELGTNKAL